MKILLDGERFVIARKPAGVLSEKSEDGEDAVSILEKELSCGIFPLHRLDRAVGGVMIFAKDRKSAADLASSFEKEYIAVVHGETDDFGVMRDLLFKDSRANKSYVVKRMRRGVREASLTYRTVDRRDSLSLVSVKLETGRSHQIRVQFASRRHPIVGDGKYGASDGCPIALFSRRITLSEQYGGLGAASLPDETFPWNKFDLISLEEAGKI